jgi:hypothetical protein
MNIEKSTETYFNIRIQKEPDGKECHDSISIAREDLSRIMVKALKENGFKVTLTRFVHKKSERFTWKEMKV